jgi:hypothetical protein
MNAWRMPKKIGKHEKITKIPKRKSEIKTEQQVKNVTQKDEHGATTRRVPGKKKASRRGLTARRPLHIGKLPMKKNRHATSKRQHSVLETRTTCQYDTADTVQKQVWIRKCPDLRL